MHTVHLTYADAVTTYFSWRAAGSGDVLTARLIPAQMDALRDSFPCTLPDIHPGEGAADALRRTFHDGAFRSPQDTWTYFSQLGAMLIPQQLIALLRGAGRSRLIIRPSPSLAQVPWAVLPTHPDGRLLGELADVVLGVPDSVRALAGAPHDGDADLMVIDPKIPGQPPTGPLGSVLGRPVDTDPLAPLVRPTTLPAADTYSGLARVPMSRQEFLASSARAGSLLFVGHVSAAGEETASAESSTLHLSEPVTAGDLLRAGWRAPRRVGLIGCSSGSDLRYPEPFGLATAAVACGAQTVVASLWTLPTEATLPAGMHPLRELVLATDRALQSADPARTLLDWQLAKARAWFSTGAPADNPAWWAAPALTERAPAREVRVWNARPHHRRNHDH
ncbi:CHAT domain-containing protein [Corynebacterium pollutisoli]|uniref:CHAT domain-containing protein n=1 Tax=Corynebacterium pollutisoli TaxID=1610489 RepID=A0A1X7J7W2_9CORY|nr:CHAT domain-containing protein [Corynebacterium pollutisoli]SMG23836.1 CHAT domain-containing protein [Corynebacterium pollutisoli]